MLTTVWMPTKKKDKKTLQKVQKPKQLSACHHLQPERQTLIWWAKDNKGSAEALTDASEGFKDK